MQRTNRKVLSLIAVLVLGGSLMLLSCSSDDDDETTDLNVSNAAAQLGGREFVFTTDNDFGVVNITLAFNADATRFALAAGNSLATGSAGYDDGTCIFTVGASTFESGTGPQVSQVFTGDPCRTDQDNNNNLTFGDATSSSNGPTTIIVD